MTEGKVFVLPEGIEQIRAVIGLGNPGLEYLHSRHNVGFMVLDALAMRAGVIWQRSGNADWGFLPGEINKISKKELTLCKPQTFMNKSGEVVAALKKTGIKPEETLVVHDELEKPLGYVALRFDGSPRGHNGLRSIIDAWGSDFWHLRVGIGRPVNKDDVARHVLAPFTPSERAVLDDVMQKILNCFLPA